MSKAHAPVVIVFETNPVAEARLTPPAHRGIASERAPDSECPWLWGSWGALADRLSSGAYGTPLESVRTVGLRVTALLTALYAVMSAFERKKMSRPMLSNARHLPTSCRSVPVKRI